MIFTKWINEQENKLPIKIYIPSHGCVIEIISYNSKEDTFEARKPVYNSDNKLSHIRNDVYFSKYIDSWATEEAYKKWTRAKKKKFVYNFSTGLTKKTTQCVTFLNKTGLTKKAWRKLKGNYVKVPTKNLKNQINVCVRQEVLNRLKKENIIL